MKHPDDGGGNRAPAAKAAARSRRKPRPRAGRPGVDRRWVVPMAIQREPDETIEGSYVLDEFGDDAGLQLWLALRSVTLWAQVPAERRPGLFPEGAAERRLEALREAGVEPALEVPLTTLAGVVSDPGGISAGVVTLACERVAEWAEARGAPGTALLFAQAGALASPEGAGAACVVGRLALAWGREARAETWLRRSIALARRGGEWEVYASAYVRLGEMLARRGAAGAARRHLLKGLRAARRWGLLRVRGRALHGLFRLARDEGSVEAAERLARGAVRAFGIHRPGAAPLLLELADFHLARGRHARAADVLRRLLPTLTAPAERVPALALLARAAAHLGDRRLYEDAWGAAWALGTADPPSRHLPAMLDLARAASHYSDWLRVDQAARLVGGAGGGAALDAEAEALLAEAGAARRREV
jgi:tetratricopeptide (TPR) repeat protein